MGSQWVEDPSWGNIFSNLATQFANAPAEALQQRALVDKIKNERADRAAAIATGNAYEKTLPQYGPTTDFNPVTASVDDSGKWSTEPLLDDPAKIPQAWTDPAGAANFDKARNFFASTGRQAALLGKTGELPGLYAQGQVGVGGVPEDQAEQQRLQFLTTGKIETAAGDNYVAKTPDGRTVQLLGTSSDGIHDAQGRKLVELAPPGSVITKAGTVDLNAKPVSSLDDKGKMADEFNAFAGRVNRNDTLTLPEIERANVLREQLYPQQGGFQTMGGRQQYVTSRPVPVPDYAGRLSGLIDHFRNGDHLQSPAAPVPYPAITGSGGMAAAANPPSASAAPAPAATPIVPPGGVGANAPRLGQQGPANPAEMRKEIMNTQAFSDYATAVPSYNTMIKAAQGDPRTGAPSNASDLNIIYAIAKLFDPGSVVREGELKLAAGAAPIAQVLQSNWSRLITGEGSLTPETRAQLIGEGLKRMEQYQQAKNLTADWYSKIAHGQGLNPAEVVPPMPDMLPYNKKAIQNPTDPSVATPPAPVDHDAVRRLLGMQ